jgi:glycosyltransferase involved in cell wall biosynthesis
MPPEPRLKILLNDYCGHPFPVELSRALARRGHQLLHLYSADDLTPKGELERAPQDPPSFAVQGVSIGVPLQKYGNLFKRRSHERAYGRLLCESIAAFRPDVVVGSNNPLEAQNLIGSCCHRRRIPFVFWLQDIHSHAIRSFLRPKSTLAAAVIGGWYRSMERRLLRRSSHIVAIADSFESQLQLWGVDSARISVIENWATLNKITRAQSDNAWRRAQGLTGKRVVLYSGTIGLKHNPDLLIAVAESLCAQPDACLVVVSQGKYADYLRDEAQRRSLSNLTVLPFQPFETFSEVLATADVLLAMIEPDAATYSVPSKVLSYLCAGRPIVLSADELNLSARTVRRANAGKVISPRDRQGFIGAVHAYLGDEAARSEAGAHGRRYAELTFDIERVTDRFETVLRAARREYAPSRTLLSTEDDLPASAS